MQVVPDQRQHGEQTGHGADDQPAVHQAEILQVAILLQEHLWGSPQQQQEEQEVSQASTQEAERRRQRDEQLTFLAASSREFFTAAPSHLSILTGFSSIRH